MLDDAVFGEKNNPWVGAWTILTVDGVPFNDFVTAQDPNLVVNYNVWFFDDDGEWEREYQVAFEASGDVTYKLFGVYGNYVLSGVNDYMMQTYPDPDNDVTGETVIGTYSIAGDLLTLEPDDGVTIVLQRRGVE